MSVKRQLLEETFKRSFDINKFSRFTRGFFNEVDILSPEKRIDKVWKEYRYYIDSYRLIARFTDSNENKIVILAVQLKKGGSVERARSMQRNFISRLISDTQYDAAIVAFYSENEPAWRLSFVRLDYEFTAKGVKLDLTPAKRYSYLVGEGEPSHTVQEQLLPLFERENYNPTLDEIEQAFSVEAVTKDFFEKYKEKYYNLKEYLDNNEAFNEEARQHSFTSEQFSKKLMGQLAFLYFIQKKGWLGVRSGTKTFIRDIFTHCTENTNKNFFDDFLEPLFYDALNKRRGDDNYYKKFNCKIPFLNGGLFEPLDNYDWQHNDFEIPNEMFSNIKTKGREADGILDIFDRYNFTMNEDEPLEREVAVDPEMLGKIFENLLDAKDRKSKGAFYTPREIVHYMCQECLINYLVNEVSVPYDDMKLFILYGELMKDEDCSKAVMEGGKAQRIPKTVYDNLLKIDAALKDIKVADPAVGSGAFSLGMLNEITRARMNITEYLVRDISVENKYDRFLLRKNRHPYRIKWETIKNCIFAVDIESSAVDIAKLRLWLSLVVDQDIDEDNPNPHPLPNLDYNIMCGNSLVDEFEGKLEFAKVFKEKGGFDVIIGNPPYISAVEGSKSDNSIRETLRKKHSPLLKGAYDMYTVFLLEGVYKSNENGVYSWIIPNKLLVSQYAEETLKFLKYNGLQYSVSVSHIEVFDNVSVYPIIALGNKNMHGYKEYIADTLDDLSNRNFKVKAEMKEFKTFADYKVKFASGATGFQAKMLANYITEEEAQGAIPFIVSGCVDKYTINFNNVRYMGKTYGRAYISQGEGIADSKWKFWSGEKIIIAGMTKLIEAVYCKEPVALGVGVYAIYEYAGFNPKYLLGLLNSKFLSYYLNIKFKEKHLAGGYLAINKSTLENLPLVKAEEKIQLEISQLADGIQSLNGDDSYAARKLYMDKIDKLVYDLYGLTKEEIKDIEHFYNK